MDIIFIYVININNTLYYDNIMLYYQKYIFFCRLKTSGAGNADTQVHSETKQEEEQTGQSEKLIADIKAKKCLL